MQNAEYRNTESGNAVGSGSDSQFAGCSGGREPETNKSPCGRDIDSIIIDYQFSTRYQVRYAVSAPRISVLEISHQFWDYLQHEERLERINNWHCAAASSTTIKEKKAFVDDTVLVQYLFATPPNPLQEWILN